MTENTAIILSDSNDQALIELGQVANAYSARNAFEDYRSRKAANTRRAQDRDLEIFAEFIKKATKSNKHLLFATDPKTWEHITHGLVDAFVQYLLSEGYAIGSLNRILSTVKKYAQLAVKAHTLAHPEYAMIKLVQGYSNNEGERINKQRVANGQQTRKTRELTEKGIPTGEIRVVKKAEAILLKQEQAKALKNQSLDTAQGRRDAVLMHILLDHGLREGEVAILKVGDVRFEGNKGYLTFKRPKVKNLIQTVELTTGTFKALQAWFKSGDAPIAADAPLLRGSRKGGALTEPGMKERSIVVRVRELGERAGVKGLSPHDCRHYWATMFYKKCKDIEKLKWSGGWSSLAMPDRYVKAALIANEGVGDID